MPWFSRVFLLVLVGAITTTCGARQSNGPGPRQCDCSRAATPVMEKRAARDTRNQNVTVSRAGNRAAFDALLAASKGAPVTQRFVGQASYYGDSLVGNKMAGGERYDPSMPFAAHRSLPFGTVVRVVRISDGRSVVLRVTDRGPFGKKRRIIDVSRAAAERLGMIREGVIEVRVEVLAVSKSAKLS